MNPLRRRTDRNQQHFPETNGQIGVGLITKMLDQENDNSHLRYQRDHLDGKWIETVMTRMVLWTRMPWPLILMQIHRAH